MKAWVWRRCSFDAAHILPFHKGKCSNLHGHTYYVELGVECRVNGTTGMGIDLGELGEFLQRCVVNRFDHSNLNDKLSGEQPTAENIADCVLDQAAACFGLPVKVRVYETADSWVEVERV